jgi:hypothetical protein
VIITRRDGAEGPFLLALQLHLAVRVNTADVEDAVRPVDCLVEAEPARLPITG